MNQTLVTAITQHYVIIKYLSELHQSIGTNAYLAKNNWIRREHGTGSGLGPSNTGSSDCAKERARGITDGLRLKYNSCDKIIFVSQTCLGLTPQIYNSDIYHIEHTYQLSHMYLDIEQEFILSGRKFSPNEIGEWVIQNQIVCAIKKGEQRSEKDPLYDKSIPFSKYKTDIFYNGINVSKYTIDQIKAITNSHFANVIAEVQAFNFSESVLTESQNLLNSPMVEHTLPEISVATSYYNNRVELCIRHYSYRFAQMTTLGNRYYNKKFLIEYNKHKGI